MVPLVVSIAAGGVIVGLLVRVIGSLVVRSATPVPPAIVAVGRQIRRVEELPGEERDRRKAA
jgi:hypothetical protein